MTNAAGVAVSIAAALMVGGCGRAPAASPTVPPVSVVVSRAPAAPSSPQARSNAATKADEGELARLALLVVGLKAASPAALRAVVSSAGLELCTNRDGQIECGPQPLGDAALRKLQDHWIPFGPNIGEQLLPVQCTATSPTHVKCFAATGGPEGVEWEFEKEGAEYRLVRTLSFWMST